MGLRGVWTPDSSFPCRDTTGKRVSGELNFRWFPVDQRIFELFGDQIHVSCIGLSPGKPVSKKSRCIGYLATILIGWKRNPDSSSPRRVTPEENILEEIRVYRLPSNHSHWVETDPGFVFPTSSYLWELPNFSQLVLFLVEKSPVKKIVVLLACLRVRRVKRTSIQDDYEATARKTWS